MIPFRLPINPDLLQYRALRATLGDWAPVLADIAASHALVGLDLRAITAGSNLVAALGDRWIVKVYPPFLRHQHQAERLALRQLAGLLPVSIPEIHADGERDGWPYLIMTRLEGRPLEEVWPDCSVRDQGAILGQIGELIAHVHRLPVGGLAALEPAWDVFLPQQVAGCRTRHERFSLPRHLLDGLDAYLGRTADALPEDFTPVILTGEYTPENLLMDRVGGRWQIRGLIDFGDTMIGFPEYDLIGPGTFLAAGRPDHLRSLLRSYGYAPDEQTPQLSCRLTRLLLLHRYSNLNVQVRTPGWQDQVQTWEEFQELVWPL